jgi:hypothetical protein
MWKSCTPKVPICEQVAVKGYFFVRNLHHPHWNGVARSVSDNTVDKSCFLPSQGQL